MQLEPKDGFNWSKVTWGRPDSVVSALCSYCSAAIAEKSVPLRMWTSDSHPLGHATIGLSAQFCSKCQRDWWGLEGYEEEEDDD